MNPDRLPRKPSTQSLSVRRASVGQGRWRSSACRRSCLPLQACSGGHEGVAGERGRETKRQRTGRKRFGGAVREVGQVATTFVAAMEKRDD